MSDPLERAKIVQRSVADITTVSIKLSLFEDMIAEIERLRKAKDQVWVADPKPRVTSMADIKTKHTGINHP